MGRYVRAWNQIHVPELLPSRRSLKTASTADTRDQGRSIKRLLDESVQSPTRVRKGVSDCQLDDTGQLLFADADMKSSWISFSGSPD